MKVKNSDMKTFYQKNGHNLASDKQFKKGFTLAEVLVTLSIIGVVAAITLPSIAQDYREKAAVARLKKTYSVLENAYRIAKAQNGEVSTWFSATGNTKTNSKIFFDQLKPHLNIVKECGWETGCFPPGNVKNLNGVEYSAAYDTNTTDYRAILADGTVLLFFINGGPDCSSVTGCGNIKVDIDGKKGAYAFGKDIFLLTIKPDRLIPAGISEDTTYKFKDTCNLGKNSGNNGVSCAGWVVFNGNMDYLHCNDLSWNGKKTCK